MSLTDTIHHHEDTEAYHAKRAVSALQKGQRFRAEVSMELTAQHRHLAYEHRDTQRITMDAFAEHYGVNR